METKTENAPGTQKSNQKTQKRSHLYRKIRDVANKKYKSGNGKVISLQSPI